MFVSLFSYMGIVKKTAMLGLFFEMCLSIKWSFCAYSLDCAPLVLSLRELI